MHFVLVNPQRVLGSVGFPAVRAGEAGRGKGTVSVGVVPQVELVLITFPALMTHPHSVLKMHHCVAERSNGSHLRVCDNLVFVASDAAFSVSRLAGHLVDLFVGGAGEKVRGLQQVGGHRMGIQELRGGIRQRRVNLFPVSTL